MKLNTFALLVALAAIVLVGCSPTKEITVETNKLIGEKYFVMRTNERIKNGAYTYYFNGAKFESGYFKSNAKDSVWSIYGSTGKPAYDIRYTAGAKDGKCTYYWDDQAVRCTGQYSYGKKVGEWVGYHNNGTVSYRGSYFDGRLKGIVKTFREDGSIEAERTYAHGKLDGKTTTYFENGELCSQLEYKEGKLHTLIELQDKSGVKIDGGTLKEGNGTLIRYLASSLSDDDKAAVKKSLTTYKSGVADGLFVEYDESGEKVISGEYDDDEYAGTWTFWDGGQETKLEDENEITAKLSKDEPVITVPGNKFKWVQTMPEFPGGVNELMRFLGNTCKYPNLAKDAGINGKVFVSFVVEPSGQVSNIKILRGIGGGCDEEAVRVVKLMPKWLPGFQDNIPIRVQFNLPVNFILR